jgi:hypothetical protein
MMKKKLGVSLIILMLGLFSCSKGIEIDLVHDFKGTWQLYQTCLTSGCLDTDPEIYVTIQFGESDLIEKQDGLVIGGGEYELSEVQDNNKDVSIYVIIVDGAGWQLDVTDTTLDITANGKFRRYKEVN